MRALLTTLAIPLLFLAMPGYAGDQTAMQEKMTSCDAQATARNLLGDDHEAFMKDCMASTDDRKRVATASEQEKMKRCRAQADVQQFKGDALKQFMNNCMTQQE